MAFDVVVVGNAGIDTSVFLPGRDIDFDVESNFTQNIDYVGQAGGYAARGYAQLGYNTAFIGALGDDMAGAMVRQAFQYDGIDLTGVFIDDSGTARSINLMSSNGQRRNFYDGKDHMNLKPDVTLFSHLFQEGTLVHFNIPNWARDLLPVARSAGCTILCDIQDVETADDSYRQDFIQEADLLFFSSANHDDPTKLIHQFWEQNPEAVIVAGMGGKGCCYAAGGDLYFCEPPAIDLPVIDTNGAGDSLAVGFATGLMLEKCSWDEAVMRGQIAARWVCSQTASTDTLITRSQMADFLAKH